MQGKMLHNYCPTDSDMVAEQARIEKQIDDFKKNVWGDGFLADTTKKDSLDAEMAAKEEKSSKGLLFHSKKEKTGAVANAKGNDSAAKKGKSEAPATTSRVSARRQRR